MPKNTRQHKKVSALPQPVHRKSVAERVGRKSYAGNGQLFSKYLHVTLDIPDGYTSASFSSEDENCSWIVPRNEAPKMLAKFKRKGYKSVLLPFTLYANGQVVKIYVLSL